VDIYIIKACCEERVEEAGYLPWVKNVVSRAQIRTVDKWPYIKLAIISTILGVVSNKGRGE
jgi:hypothetical protein